MGFLRGVSCGGHVRSRLVVLRECVIAAGAAQPATDSVSSPGEDRAIQYSRGSYD
ncbi:hypothetical protein NK6_3290 [Bradyrhizobium diazoefficiens]|uniref:Uncharacterized protein n=1 Tax=Bradyrhizobium diazoefficiens TaxID=1355477 RepID=A0A0E4BNX8_9BRAD|nr:hypothetical protein NK6_3290 [Bradyrhizobium diazoefficiens]